MRKYVVYWISMNSKCYENNRYNFNTFILWQNKNESFKPQFKAALNIVPHKTKQKKKKEDIDTFGIITVKLHTTYKHTLHICILHSWVHFHTYVYIIKKFYTLMDATALHCYIIYI